MKKVFCPYCGAARLVENLSTHKTLCFVKMEICPECGISRRGTSTEKHLTCYGSVVQTGQLENIYADYDGVSDLVSYGSIS